MRPTTTFIWNPKSWACGVAGIIAGTITMKGLANMMIIALFLTMLCCINLGMGVPAVASHFFVFYFGIVADLTHPVALAAYAGAAIAQANPMKTALTATKLAIGAFIVPYVFALNPAILFVDTTVLEVITISITSFVDTFAMAAALEAYLFHHMPWYLRIVSLVGDLMLIYPGTVTDIVGIALVALMVLVQFTAGKKVAAVKG